MNVYYFPMVSVSNIENNKANLIARQKESEDINYFLRIATLNGLEYQEVVEDEIIQVYDSYVEGVEPVVDIDTLRNKYLGQITLDREWYVKLNTFFYAMEAKYDLAQSLTYGLFAKTYLRMLREHKLRSGNNNQHSSLLIGSLTPQTSAEYSAVVRHIHPKSRPFVIDIEPHDGMKVPNDTLFCVADGTNLPFKHESFDSVHTNLLLTMISTNESMNIARARQKLFRQVHNALNKKGTLMMVEYYQSEEYKDELIAELFGAGFEDLDLVPAKKFNSRRLADRYMRENFKGSYDDSIENTFDFIGITAIK